MAPISGPLVSSTVFRSNSTPRHSPPVSQNPVALHLVVAHQQPLASPRRIACASSGSSLLGRVISVPSQALAVPMVVIGSTVPITAPAPTSVGAIVGQTGSQVLPAPGMVTTPRGGFGSQSGSRVTPCANSTVPAVAIGTASAARTSGCPIVVSSSRSPRTRAQQKLQAGPSNLDGKDESKARQRAPTPESLAAALAQADNIEESLARKRSLLETNPATREIRAAAGALADNSKGDLDGAAGPFEHTIPTHDNADSSRDPTAQLFDSALASRSFARVAAQTQECLLMHTHLQKILTSNALHAPAKSSDARLCSQRVPSAASRPCRDDDDAVAEADEERAMEEVAALSQLKVGLQEEVAYLSSEAHALTAELRRVRGGSDLFGEAVRSGVELELELLHKRRCALEAVISQRSRENFGVAEHHLQPQLPSDARLVSY